MIDDKRTIEYGSWSGEWETPPELFGPLHRKYNYTLDAAASAANAKLADYYSSVNSAFESSWYGRVWLNPPYGREIRNWLARAYDQRYNCERIDILVPAYTDTSWWHEFCMEGMISLIVGRVSFIDHRPDGSVTRNTARFPSAVISYGDGIRKRTLGPSIIQEKR